MILSERTKIAPRLLCFVMAVNIVGLACFTFATRAHSPLAASDFNAGESGAATLDSVGFGLMLPGIFFASIAFLCARIFAWDGRAAFGVWYATGFAINLFSAWKIGRALDTEQARMRGQLEE